uniref:neuron navigator 2-like isoform X2 n=1 Tax=Myxine glutinosa TaxID=7769 RepID=UPI00358E9BEC
MTSRLPAPSMRGVAVSDSRLHPPCSLSRRSRSFHSFEGVQQSFYSLNTSEDLSDNVQPTTIAPHAHQLHMGRTLQTREQTVAISTGSSALPTFSSTLPSLSNTQTSALRTSTVDRTRESEGESGLRRPQHAKVRTGGAKPTGRTRCGVPAGRPGGTGGTATAVEAGRAASHSKPPSPNPGQRRSTLGGSARMLKQNEKDKDGDGDKDGDRDSSTLDISDTRLVIGPSSGRSATRACSGIPKPGLKSQGTRVPRSLRKAQGDSRHSSNSSLGSAEGGNISGRELPNRNVSDCDVLGHDVPGSDNSGNGIAMTTSTTQTPALGLGGVSLPRTAGRDGHRNMATVAPFMYRGPSDNEQVGNSPSEEARERVKATENQHRLSTGYAEGRLVRKSKLMPESQGLEGSLPGLRNPQLSFERESEEKSVDINHAGSSLSWTGLTGCAWVGAGGDGLRSDGAKGAGRDGIKGERVRGIRGERLKGLGMRASGSERMKAHVGETAKGADREAVRRIGMKRPGEEGIKIGDEGMKISGGERAKGTGIEKLRLAGHGRIKKAGGEGMRVDVGERHHEDEGQGLRLIDSKRIKGAAGEVGRGSLGRTVLREGLMGTGQEWTKGSAREGTRKVGEEFRNAGTDGERRVDGDITEGDSEAVPELVPKVSRFLKSESRKAAQPIGRPSPSHHSSQVELRMEMEGSWGKGNRSRARDPERGGDRERSTDGDIGGYASDGDVLGKCLRRKGYLNLSLSSKAPRRPPAYRESNMNSWDDSPGSSSSSISDTIENLSTDDLNTSSSIGSLPHTPSKLLPLSLASPPQEDGEESSCYGDGQLWYQSLPRPHDDTVSEPVFPLTRQPLRPQGGSKDTLSHQGGMSFMGSRRKGQRSSALRASAKTDDAKVSELQPPGHIPPPLLRASSDGDGKDHYSNSPIQPTTSRPTTPTNSTAFGIRRIGGSLGFGDALQGAGGSRGTGVLGESATLGKAPRLRGGPGRTGRRSSALNVPLHNEEEEGEEEEDPPIPQQTLFYCSLPRPGKASGRVSHTVTAMPEYRMSVPRRTANQTDREKVLASEGENTGCHSALGPREPGLSERSFRRPELSRPPSRSRSEEGSPPARRSFVLKSSRLENISSFSTLSSSLHPEPVSLGLNQVDGDQGHDQMSSQGHRISGERDRGVMTLPRQSSRMSVSVASEPSGEWPRSLSISSLNIPLEAQSQMVPKMHPPAHGSSLSIASCSSSVFSMPEEKGQNEVQKLRGELNMSNDKASALTSQLSTNAHLVGVFEETLNSMAYRLQDLAFTAQNKDVQLSELRQTIELVKQQNSLAQAALSGVLMSAEPHAESMGLLRQPSTDSITSGSSIGGNGVIGGEASGLVAGKMVGGVPGRTIGAQPGMDLPGMSQKISVTDGDVPRKKKKGWLRSSFKQAFGKKKKAENEESSGLDAITSTLTESVECADAIESGEVDEGKETGEWREEGEKSDACLGESDDKGDGECVEGPTIVRLRGELRSKELKLTDVRLEALGSAHQLDQLHQLMSSMQMEIERLKVENDRLKGDVVQTSRTKGTASGTGRVSDSMDGVDGAAVTEGADSKGQVGRRRTDVQVTNIICLRVIIAGYEDKVMQLGSVSLRTEASWEALDSILRLLFKEYLIRIDPTSCLGLGWESVTGYQLGIAFRCRSLPSPPRLPASYATAQSAAVRLMLKGPAEGCVDSLALLSLSPKPCLLRSLSLLSLHRRFVLSGPPDSQKTRFALGLAWHLANVHERTEDVEEADDAAGAEPVVLIKLKELTLKECNERVREALNDHRLQVLMLDDLHVISDPLALLSPLHSSAIRPYVIVTMEHVGPSGPDITSLPGFGLLHLSPHSEPIKGLLGRNLRQELIQAGDWGPGAQEVSGSQDGAGRSAAMSPMARVVDWLPRLWRQLNRQLETRGEDGGHFGLGIFIGCPMDISASYKWFLDIWLNQLLPRLQSGDSLFQWILDSQPWAGPLPLSPTLASKSKPDPLMAMLKQLQASTAGDGNENLSVQSTI